MRLRICHKRKVAGSGGEAEVTCPTNIWPLLHQFSVWIGLRDIRNYCTRRARLHFGGRNSI